MNELDTHLKKALLSKTPHLERAAFCISQGANVNMIYEECDVISSGWTEEPLLHVLVGEGYIESLKFLLKQPKISVNILNNVNDNALQYALYVQAPQLQESAGLLIAAGISLNNKNVDDEDVFACSAIPKKEKIKRSLDAFQSFADGRRWLRNECRIKKVVDAAMVTPFAKSVSLRPVKPKNDFKR